MKLNVLVVDDSAVMRAMIVRTLSLCRLPIGATYEAANGAEALALLDQVWIDVALVDINMPVMPGDELIETVRSKPVYADLPIVVVSTEGSATRIARLRQLGARFVHKPFRPEQLRDEIRALTGVETHDDQHCAADSGSFDF